MRPALTMNAKCEPKKKTWFVKCEVNMDASHYEVVLVKATKPHLARQKAEAELRNKGFFHARAFYCKEME